MIETFLELVHEISNLFFNKLIFFKDKLLIKIDIDHVGGCNICIKPLWNEPEIFHLIAMEK